MVQISKQEADKLRAADPTIYISTTGSRKKSRNKRRYVEEDVRALRLLPGNPQAVALLQAYECRERMRRKYAAGN